MNENVTSWQDTQKLLAFIIVGGFLTAVFLWMFLPPHGSESQVAVLNTLVGVLGGFAGTVVTFYFGNSRSNANKDETIKQIALGPTPPPQTPSPPKP